MKLEIQTGKEKKEDPTIASDMHQAGIHIFTDKGFFERVDEIREYFPNYMSTDEVKKLELTPKRELLLITVNRDIAHLSYHSAFGLGLDNPILLDKIHAAFNLADMAMDDLIHSKLSDDDLWEFLRADIEQIKKVVVATFNARNSTVQKTFVSQGMLNMMAGVGGGMDPSLRDALAKAFEQQQGAGTS